MIKAVFFDAGNTLFRPHPSVGDVYARVARKHGAKLAPAAVEKRFLTAWKTRNGSSSLHSEGEERSWWKGLVGEVFDGAFTDEARFDGFFEELYAVFARPATWRLYDDALPALEGLKRKGLKVGIVSNWDRRLFALCDGLGVTPRVDFILASAMEGTAKPEAEIFRRALERAGVEAGEALHVGDSYREDYLGARAAGLRARLLCRGGVSPDGVESLTSLAEL